MFLIIIGTILGVMFGIIILIILINIALNNRSQKKSKQNLQEIMDSSPYRKSQPIPKPHSDFLFRDKEQEKEFSQEAERESGVIKYDPHNLSVANNKEETRIIGIAEPKGFWSKFVMSQKLGYIIARMTAQDSGKNGFWVNLIKAQSMSQGKDQSRGR